MADPIIIYTDGAASGNPGPGGFGVVLKAGVYRKELMAGFRKTTNNRMELLAVIVGLEALKQPGWQVVVYSIRKEDIPSGYPRNVSVRFLFVRMGEERI